MPSLHHTLKVAGAITATLTINGQSIPITLDLSNLKLDLSASPREVADELAKRYGTNVVPFKRGGK